MHDFCVDGNQDLESLSDKYQVSIIGLKRGLLYEFSEGQARLEIQDHIERHKKIAGVLESQSQFGDPRSAAVWLNFMSRIAELTSVKQLVVQHYESDILRVAKRIQA